MLRWLLGLVGLGLRFMLRGHDLINLSIKHRDLVPDGSPLFLLCGEQLLLQLVQLLFLLLHVHPSLATNRMPNSDPLSLVRKPLVQSVT